jgi:hypothetical protein
MKSHGKKVFIGLVVLSLLSISDTYAQHYDSKSIITPNGYTSDFHHSRKSLNARRVQSSSDSSSGANWYPLQIGNRWDYYWNYGGGSDYYGLESVTVLDDTVMPNFQKYFKLSHVYKDVLHGDTSNGGKSVEYQRIDSISDVYSYDTIVNCESVEYRLGLPVGGTDLILHYGCGYPDTTLCYFDSVSGLFNLVFWGDTVLTKRIERWDTTIGYGARLTAARDFWAQGIGLTEDELELEGRSLVGAIINSDTLGGLIDAIKEGFRGSLPMDFVLYQNYPNPFNPSTIIEYHIGKRENATLSIYDILGREVTTLVNSKQSPGDYRISWNGKNKNGMNLGSGTYICRLQVGSYVESRKMILLR